MHNRIKQELTKLEQTQAMHILFACESGSRAWGFPSADSDYDVRFVYVRERDWYLSINLDQAPDVIEQTIDDQLDLAGWDVRKALWLLSKSNPQLLEWFGSPIIYRQAEAWVERIRAIQALYYQPAAAYFHYLHMAEGNYRTSLQGELVRAKKYLYVLRPLLALNWIEHKHSIVPMEFATLVEELVTDTKLKTAIEDLVERKKQGHELDNQPRIEPIDDFITQELERARTYKPATIATKPELEPLNQLFRWTIQTSETAKIS